MMVIILAVSCQCVTCCSSMAGNTYGGMEAEFGVSREVCVLSISLFVAGLGVGPRECLETPSGQAVCPRKSPN